MNADEGDSEEIRHEGTKDTKRTGEVNHQWRQERTEQSEKLDAGCQKCGTASRSTYTICGSRQLAHHNSPAGGTAAWEAAVADAVEDKLDHIMTGSFSGTMRRPMT
jgi:hypothetical protein